jgi:membrane protease YdiL (CAAX protease family)
LQLLATGRRLSAWVRVLMGWCGGRPDWSALISGATLVSCSVALLSEQTAARPALALAASAFVVGANYTWLVLRRRGPEAAAVADHMAMWVGLGLLVGAF